MDEIKSLEFDMPLMKIIYISYSPLSAQIRQDWFIDYFIDRGALVEYWDVSAIIFGKSLGKSVETDFLRVPSSYHDIKKMLSYPENEEACYFVLMSYEGRTAGLFKLISDCGGKMLYLVWGRMPLSHVSRGGVNIKGRLLNPLSSLTAVLNKFKALAYRRLHLIRPFDVVFVAGRTTGYPAVKVVPINAPDFDVFHQLSLVENVNAIGGKYAVFLDQYLPHHPDGKLSSTQRLTSTSYYESLNRFFDLFEKKYNLEVVIAAHPKADYEEYFFSGRKVIPGMSAQLVQSAEIVIAHYSTSVSFAVLFLKPIVFVYTHEMLQLYEYTMVSIIRDIAAYLDAYIYNIDDIADGRQIHISTVNRLRYENYIYDFLATSESEKMMSREIIWREFELLSGDSSDS